MPKVTPCEGAEPGPPVGSGQRCLHQLVPGSGPQDKELCLLSSSPFSSMMCQLSVVESKSATFPSEKARHLLDDSVLESRSPRRGLTLTSSTAITNGLSLGKRLWPVHTGRGSRPSMCSVSVSVSLCCAQWPLTLKEWLPTGVSCCRKEFWVDLLPLMVPKWTVKLKKEAGLESTTTPLGQMLPWWHLHQGEPKALLRAVSGWATASYYVLVFTQRSQKGG